MLGSSFCVFFGIEKVAADERWVGVVGIAASIFVGAVERSAYFFFAEFLVDVNSSFGG
jgi:hypothetical protein